ncbi:MAG TPA: imidazolonepropionase [Ardenticatenaceae bacterium]|nr:imidazolonepropionase [Ardenticatenaceae bacterium]
MKDIKPNADLLVRNISRLAVVPGPGPRRGADLAEIGLVPRAALLVGEGRVLWAGPEQQLPAASVRAEYDAGGRAVVPGFVDPHTHAVFAGDRVEEFERRVRGATYQEILAGGGGILSTVRATRAASLETIVAESAARLEAMLAHGTTTVEIKTGYGLSLEGEIKLLRAIERLAGEFAGRLTIVPTFLPAHAVPAEHRDDPDAFVDEIVREILPAGMAAHTETAEGSVSSGAAGKRPGVASLLFADVFCEAGVFDVAQTRHILERARDLGYGLKLHVDEFEALGGTSLACELGATSADHLMATGPEEIALLAASRTVAVLLPGTTFGLGKHDYARARDFIGAGAAVALATDLNPGTCWCVSMPFIMALAARYLRLSAAEALAAATLNAAHAVGLGHERGSLSPGYAADFLVLATDDERHLAYRFGQNLVAAVFKEGSLLQQK